VVVRQQRAAAATMTGNQDSRQERNRAGVQKSVGEATRATDGDGVQAERPLDRRQGESPWFIGAERHPRNRRGRSPDGKDHGLHRGRV